jgi:MFS family permease
MNQRTIALTLFLGVAFFLVTATTFASLGVLLPAMIAEFRWSWTTAGLGFTALSLLTGVFSPIAAGSLIRLGPVRHYAVAGAVMAAGYALLGAAAGVVSYLVATALMGAGFALLANVPGTYLVGRAAPANHRSIHIGAYLAAGGAGGILGPIMANALINSGADWRLYWRLSALAILIVAIAIALLARRVETGAAPRKEGAASEASLWTARMAIRTPAFAIIALALTVVYFCGVTVSTWSVAHLQRQGLEAGFAVVMLSLYSGVNAAARAAGGFAVKRVSAKTLLTIALLGNVVGMSALAYAASEPVAIAFALFDGFAFGMALFATTALLIDAFGLKNSPALLGAVNLAATVAMLGPTIAGQTADRWGGFGPIFLFYAGAALVAAIAVAAMPAPQRTPQ